MIVKIHISVPSTLYITEPLIPDQIRRSPAAPTKKNQTEKTHIFFQNTEAGKEGVNKVGVEALRSLQSQLSQGCSVRPPGVDLMPQRVRTPQQIQEGLSLLLSVS